MWPTFWFKKRWVKQMGESVQWVSSFLQFRFFGSEQIQKMFKASSDDKVSQSTIISSSYYWKQELFRAQLSNCSLQWCHKKRDGVSNHQPHDCLLNRLFKAQNQRKPQTSATRAFVRGINQWPVNSPHKGPITRKMFPFDDVIMLRITRQYHSPLLHYEIFTRSSSQILLVYNLLRSCPIILKCGNRTQQR